MENGQRGLETGPSVFDASYDAAAELEAQDKQLDGMGALGRYLVGTKNGSVVKFARRVQEERGLLSASPELAQEDPQFISTVGARVTKDLPTATDTEAEYLADAPNMGIYLHRLNWVRKGREADQLVSRSGLAMLGQGAMDAGIPMGMGLGITKGAATIAARGTRMAVAGGAGAGGEALFELSRQRMALEQTDASMVALAGTIGGFAGIVFDGMLGAATKGQLTKETAEAVAKADGARPVATVVDDVEEGLEGAAKAADDPSSPAVSPALNREASPAGNLKATEGDNLEAALKGNDAPAPKVPAKSHEEILEGLEARTQALRAELKANTGSILNQLVRRTEVAQSELKALREAADAEYGETAISRAFKESRRAEEEAYWAAHQGKPLSGPQSQPSATPAAGPQSAPEGALHVPEASAAQAAGALSAAALEDPLEAGRQAVEGGAPEALLKGRFRLKDGNASFAPVFASPVDRALATLGAAADPQHLEAALQLARKAFPGETDKTLVSMAEDFVDNKLLPELRRGGTSAVQVPRLWDKLSAQPFQPLERVIEAVQPAAVRAFADNAPVTEASVVLHSLDKGGVALKESLAQANGYVTKEALSDGFATLGKNPETATLASHMALRAEGYKAVYGVEPDLHTVRSWMGGELYNRRVFDLQQEATERATKAELPASPKTADGDIAWGKQVDEAEGDIPFGGRASREAGRILPKLLLPLGGGAVLSVVMMQDANAANGSAVSGTLSALAATGLALFGGKAAIKAMQKLGVAERGAMQRYERAVKMQKAGATPQDIEAATDFKVMQDGTLRTELNAQDLLTTAEARGARARDYNEFVADTRGLDRAGAEHTPTLALDDQTKIARVQDIGNRGYERMEFSVFGKKLRLHLAPKWLQSLRHDAVRIDDSPSVTARGLGQLVLNNVVGRTGKVANEMAAEALWRVEQVGASGKAHNLFKDGRREWYAERGVKVPNRLNLKANEADQRVFNLEVARAKELPGDPTVSEAARKVAAAVTKAQGDKLKQLQQVIGEMEARGIVIGADEPLGIVKRLLNDPTYVPHVRNAERALEMEARIGLENTYALFTKALHARNPGLTAEHAAKAGRAWVDTLKRLDDQMGVTIPKGKGDEIVAAMRNDGLDDATIELVKKTLGLTDIEGIPGTLQARRVDFDMGTRMRFEVDGQDIEVGIEDFYERDLLQLHGRWMHEMNGLLAYAAAGAKHGVNLASDAEWALLLRKATNEGATPEHTDLLNAHRDYVLGRKRDKDVFGRPTQVERMVRGLTTWQLGSDFALAQAGDVGSIGPKALTQLHKLPAYVKLQAELKAGNVTPGQLRSLLSFLHHGMDHTSAAVGNLAEGGIDAGATVLDKMLHMQSRVNGMHHIAQAVEMAVVSSFERDLMEYALKGTADKATWKHYAAYGIDQPVADELVPLLKDAARFDEDGVFQYIDYDVLQQASALDAARLKTAFKRAAQSANSQPLGAGETAQFLRASPVGRLMGQLQSTAFNITLKLQRDLHNFDPIVVQKWVSSFVFAGVGVMARNVLRFGHDREELEKRMEPKRLALAAFRQSAVAGVYPNLIDGVATNVFGMNGIFQDTVSGRGAGEVAAQAGAKNLLTAGGAVRDMLFGGPADNFTKSEARALQRLLAPSWMAGGVVSYLSKDLETKNDRVESPEPQR